jgi:hypothetical protein
LPCDTDPCLLWKVRCFRVSIVASVDNRFKGPYILIQ